ncbi:MAG: hypothetical protein AAF810_18545 [Cyanobacteria bacterium P01_D01_bin.36]
MKLPTAKFPAKLQEMKRQSAEPLRRLSGQPVKNIWKNVQTKLGTRSPFKKVPSAAEIKSAKGSKLMLNLLLVRPWVLVMALWLLSMATGALALNGMLNPRKLRMALPEPALESGASNQANALLKVDQAADSSGESEAQTSVIEIGGAAEGGVADGAKRGSGGVPALPIMALVGACAAGSVVISRRRAMARLAAARAQGRKRRVRIANPAGAPVRAVKESGAAAVSGGAKSQKRRPRTRKPAAQPVSTGSKVLASRTTAQKQKAAQPKRTQRKVSRKAQKVAPSMVQKVASTMRSPAKGASPVRSATRVSRSQARRAAMRAASRRQPLVSVVPANESHALDWSQGSLAHQMDMRPHRSAV